MPTKKRSVRKAEAIVRELAPRFGLGHYRWSVTALDEERAAPAGGLWGCSNFDHSEEYFDIAVVPDGVLPEPVLRHLILHELAHGIITYAAGSEAHEETACDRIAKLVMGEDAAGPNYNLCGGPDRIWEFEMDSDDVTIARILRGAGAARSGRRPRSNPRKNWDDDKEQSIVSILDSVPNLSDREKYVLGAIYIQGNSFREVARALGVSPRTVTRVRNQLVKKLSSVHQ